MALPVSQYRKRSDQEDVRFEFGKNWSKFLPSINAERVEQAELSIKEMLGLQDLTGKTFLDAGSGSGLFSLAARRLGARVHSFDYDQNSTACTNQLRQLWRGDDQEWRVEAGSILDESYLNKVGLFDVVYSWGVVHHTGDMWRALQLLSGMVKSDGYAFISVYNDQGLASKMWRQTKRLYVSLPRYLRFLVLVPAACRLWGFVILRGLLSGRLISTYRRLFSTRERGMSGWRDLVDWVGGYPFEVAKPEEIFEFFYSKGFTLTKLRTCRGGHGCNQFVFLKNR